MAGSGGELAAVFQARRSGIPTKKVEGGGAAVEKTSSFASSTSSGELAAILQARKKIASGDGGSDNSSNVMTPPRVVAAMGATTPMSPTSVTKGTPKFPLPSMPSPGAAAPTVSASPIRNKELTATFESRDLEVGIPTPGFLQDVRKNLKKPGEKKVVTSSPAASASATNIVAAKGGSGTAEKAKQTIVPEQRDEGEGGLASSSSSTKTSSTRDDLMAARRSRMVASRSAKADNNAGNGSRSTAKSDNSSGSTGTPTNKAAKSNTSTSNGGGATPKSLTPLSPASARREKLRARVRASSSSSYMKQTTPSSSKSDSASPGKVFITSPTKDEFEMSFVDASYPAGPSIPDFDDNGNDKRQKPPMKQTQNFELMTDSSIESAYNDLYATSTGSTMKTTNNSSSSKDIQFRDCHRASTPKICGSQHSAYDDDITDPSRPEGLLQRESSSGTSDLQPYALARSPSHGSQMSAITTPSCFPQDNGAYPSASGVQHHTILEAISSFGDAGSTPTDKSSHEEMMHMREQMQEFKQKLAEKDAIISQLMRRISDLEKGQPLGTYQQQPPPRSSFGTDNNASAFSSPRASITAKISKNKGGFTGDVTKKSFNNAASQPDHYEKKFVC